jgi:phosphotransferase system  glucose/maltose/N-acetylglucosamine-specific IIC component
MRAAVELPVQSAVAAQVEQEQSHGELIFGYFWLFLVIFGYFWLFLVIFGYFCYSMQMGN